MKKYALLLGVLLCMGYQVFAQGLGIDQSSPASKLDVNGGVTVGATYSGTDTAPSNGMIIEGNVGIGNNDPAYQLDVTGDARVGWHGSSTRIKILPNDIMINDDNDENPMMYENDAAGKGIKPGHEDNELYAIVAIPTGYKATHARMYGSSTDLVTVYEGDLTDGTFGASLGSANTGTEIDITDVSSTTTNYLVIYIATNANTDVLYGGYVTIAPI